jgi:hypothetical protein
MRIEDLRRAKDQRPFKPFRIRTADGREVEVKHPDAIAWEPTEFPRTLICILPGGQWEVIDVGLVTSLGMESPASTVGEKAGG